MLATGGDGKHASHVWLHCSLKPIRPLSIRWLHPTVGTNTKEGFNGVRGTRRGSDGGMEGCAHSSVCVSIVALCSLGARRKLIYDFP